MVVANLQVSLLVMEDCTLLDLVLTLVPDSSRYFLTVVSVLEMEKLFYTFQVLILLFVLILRDPFHPELSSLD